MRWILKSVAAPGVAALLALSGTVNGAQNASDLAVQAMQECDRGQDARAREQRKRHFERGEALAAQAVALDEKSAPAHFAIVCNLGEILRLDGEKITSVFALRRLMTEVDRTLELDPEHVDAMATKGNLLLRLPRMFGGDPTEGERLLREVVKRDDNAVTSRITLARTCVERGERDEATRLASRALQIARQEGRADKAAEAQATLDELGSGAR